MTKTLEILFLFLGDPVPAFLVFAWIVLALCLLQNANRDDGSGRGLYENMRCCRL